jgi:zinc protease
MRGFVACFLLALGCGGLPKPILPLARTPDADFRRGAPPAVAGVNALRLPKTETRTLRNGLLVVVVSRKDLPLVSAELVVRGAGIGPDVPDSVAALMTAIALIDPPEEIMHSGTSRDAAFLGFTSSREQFARTAKNFADAVRKPAFSDPTMKTTRRLATDRVSRGDAESRIEEVANRLLYERPPPQLRSETARIDDIGRARLVDFHRGRYRPESSAFIIVGALDPAEGFELAERLFGDWTAASPAPTRGTPTLPTLVPRVGLRPISAFDSRAEIAHARFVIPGPPDGHPELPAFKLLGATLGGSVSSRGVSSLRIHDAATYAVSAEVYDRRDGSELVIEFAAHSRDLVASIERMLAEIELLRREPLSAAELQRTKTTWQADIAGLLAQNGRTAHLLAWRFALGGDPANLYAYLLSVMSTDASALLAVARSAFAPNRIQISVIGNANEIRVPLERLTRVIWDASTTTQR